MTSEPPVMRTWLCFAFCLFVSGCGAVFKGKSIIADKLPPEIMNYQSVESVVAESKEADTTSYVYIIKEDKRPGDVFGKSVTLRQEIDETVIAAIINSIGVYTVCNRSDVTSVHEGKLSLRGGADEMQLTYVQEAKRGIVRIRVIP